MAWFIDFVFLYLQCIAYEQKFFLRFFHELVWGEIHGMRIFDALYIRHGMILMYQQTYQIKTRV